MSHFSFLNDLIAPTALVFAVLVVDRIVSVIKKRREERETKLREELAELRHRWHVCLKENECARELNAKIVDGAVDRDSEDEWRRRLARNELIASNERLFVSLRKRELWIMKKLGSYS